MKKCDMYHIYTYMIDLIYIYTYHIYTYTVDLTQIYIIYTHIQWILLRYISYIHIYNGSYSAIKKAFATTWMDKGYYAL